jgi:glycosyltransferase involved in cell wall biosynthesis
VTLSSPALETPAVGHRDAALCDPAPAAAARSFGEVVLAHDYLNQRGGAERVALELARMWPRAPMLTALYRPESTFPEFRRHRIWASFLDRLPVDRRFRGLLPLYPIAFESFGRVDADLVICSTSGFAHGLQTTGRTRRVVYCHSPARWLYSRDYLRAWSAGAVAATPLFGALRAVDRRAARRADVYVANSHNVRRRIKAAYGIDTAAVVPPPVDVERFTPRARGRRLLTVSRLLPYKRLDVLVEAANRARLELDVVGDGPQRRQLRDLAGPTITFHGSLDDRSVTQLMESCRAYCTPGVEDFGITSVEAQAAGKPVVAFADGGALETVTEGFTGTFFSEWNADSLLAALRRADGLDASPEQIAQQAKRFSCATFRHRLEEAISASL